MIEIVASAVAAGAAVASVWLAFRAIKLELRNFEQGQAEQMYIEYTRRYQDILKALPFGCFDPDGLTKDSTLTSEQRSTVHAYIDMCSEEVKLRLRGKIEAHVWKDWEDGIRLGVKSPLVQEIWLDAKWFQTYSVLSKFVDEGIDSARAEFTNSVTSLS